MITIERSDIELGLLEVLYFKKQGDNKYEVGRAQGKDRKTLLSRREFDGVEEITKHESWSYEKEVRLVAKVSALSLGQKSSHKSLLQKVSFR